MKQHIFIWRQARPPLFTAVLVLAGLMAAGSTRAADVTGSAAWTTDYVWRGTTQTHGDPAVQAGLKVATASGFYASLWGSNVEFAPALQASSELDLAAGWTGNVGEDWALDVNVLHYRYPSAAVDLNWTELNGTLTWKQHYWASIGYSNQTLGYDADGVYAQIGARIPVSDTIRLEAAGAHYFLDDAVVAEDGYSHGQLSAIWAFKAPFELRVTAHATDSDAERIFGDDFAGSRIEAAVQASF